MKSQPTAEDRLLTASNAPAVREPSLKAVIGRKVRALRQRHEITAVELATQARLSAGMLSKIESGSSSPSLLTLQALARALHVPLAAFFAEFDERRDCSYVKAGQGVVIERRGTKAGHRYELLGHSLAGDLAAEPYLITLSEGAAPYMMFQHEGIEFLYMIEGSVTYRHADKSYRMMPGDSLFFDSAALHGPEILHELPCRFLSIIIYNRK